MKIESFVPMDSPARKSVLQYYQSNASVHKAGSAPTVRFTTSQLRANSRESNFLEDPPKSNVYVSITVVGWETRRLDT